VVDVVSSILSDAVISSTDAPLLFNADDSSNMDIEKSAPYAVGCAVTDGYTVTVSSCTDEDRSVVGMATGGGREVGLANGTGLVKNVSSSA
jgi:hypothetical protein